MQFKSRLSALPDAGLSPTWHIYSISDNAHIVAPAGIGIRTKADALRDLPGAAGNG